MPDGPRSDHSDLKVAFQPLTESMQLVFFDHRGQGRSAKGDPVLYNLDKNVQDMEALRQHLGLGAIVSIGTSYGGMVAMAHAARYPASVSHLVLIVTAAHAGFNARARQIVAERGTAEQQAVCGQLWAGELDDVTKLHRYYEVMGPLYSRKFDGEKARLGRERGIATPEALNRAFAPGGFRPRVPGCRNSSETSSTPSWNAASWRTASCGCTAATAATTNCWLSAASAGASARHAARGAWPRPRRIW